MLHVNDLVYRIGGRVLLDGATCHIPAGARVGLVGRNGTGKSTLLKLILGEVAPDSGDIVVRPRASVGRVAQEAPAGDRTLVDCVLAADLERARLLADLPDAEAAADAHRIAEIHERLNAIDAHSAPARAASILAGLGFSAEAQERFVGDFSGGWRMRVALAAALFARPELLLLDEPTNHLDLEATVWLENYLAVYPGTLIIVSHDRDLLNKVCQRIVHLDKGKLVSYQGGYDDFARQRREMMELREKAAVKQEARRAHLQSFVDRFRAKATKARQAQSRLKMLEKMEPVIPIVEDRSVSFDFPQPDELAPPLIQVESGKAGYDGRPVLGRLSFRIDMDDRIALLGANGNGKSTLAKVITGRLALMEGEMKASTKLRVGYFAQHQTEELNPQGTPFQHMAKLMPGVADAKVRAHLGRFGFGAELADNRVEQLSGGEKARLLIALMTHDAPHILVLDEPTNHLDIDTRDALIEALNTFEGAVVLISHDPHLVELVADRLWLVADGRVTPFDGDMQDYRKLLLDRAREARREAKAEARADAEPSAQSAAARKEDRRAAAELRQKAAPLKKVAQTAEKKLEDLTEKRRKVEAQLADPKLYDGPGERVAALQKELGELTRAVEEMEMAWLEAQEAYEEAMAAGG
ncbi:ABC-F family ATP-binding cassette domain-containing protein [Caenispirillum bisanense]|uniref:Probable ATP-binding protein YheS n=1 Tax=Caenispirillum bisanense TaxID=414052 RepID=A0A286GNK2_9PROT|nr:ABC-F family ATP-binding cassette domain-containing protein [Caenispirillum bisanense]SOD97100.1 ATP-binding cassette, subfamily F, member 3 [Caenispirillum bisanense]